MWACSCEETTGLDAEWHSFHMQVNNRTHWFHISGEQFKLRAFLSSFLGLLVVEADSHFVFSSALFLFIKLPLKPLNNQYPLVTAGINNNNEWWEDNVLYNVVWSLLLICSLVNVPQSTALGFSLMLNVSAPVFISFYISDIFNKPRFSNGFRRDGLQITAHQEVESVDWSGSVWGRWM